MLLLLLRYLRTQGSTCIIYYGFLLHYMTICDMVIHFLFHSIRLYVHPLHVIEQSTLYLLCLLLIQIILETMYVHRLNLFCISANNDFSCDSVYFRLD